MNLRQNGIVIKLNLFDKEKRLIKSSCVRLLLHIYVGYARPQASFCHSIRVSKRGEKSVD